MLNEIDRRQVQTRLLGWISRTLEKLNDDDRRVSIALELQHKETNMPNDNIFSGLKVVDLASFIAGPSAAVILSDFGAEVIKVEPPNGELLRIANHLPPQPHSEDAYPWHL